MGIHTRTREDAKVQTVQRFMNAVYYFLFFHSHHPYLFFNNDGITFTFFGFRIVNGDLLDQETDELIEKDIMTKDLYEVIVKSMQNDIINFETDFEKLDR